MRAREKRGHEDKGEEGPSPLSNHWLEPGVSCSAH